MKATFTDIRYVILITGIMGLAIIVSYFARRALARYTLLSSEKLNVDPIRYKFLKFATSVIIYSVALIIIFHLLPGLEKIGTTILASAGILSVIIGLAAQQTFGNIISGIFIFIYKPFRVGEYVEMNSGKNGIVEDINLRFTVIRNGENRRMIIPNTLISNEVIINSNPSVNRVCCTINVRVDYETDLDRAIDTIQKIISAHPDFYDNRSQEKIEQGTPAVTVQVTSLDNYSVNLAAIAWCRSDSASNGMKCDSLLAIKKRFDSIGIKMASQTRKIIFVNPEDEPGK